MTVHSNGKFLGVSAVPPLEGAGWTVKVRDYRDFNTLVAVVTDPVAITVGPELCARGAGSVSLSLESPFWSVALPDGRSARALLDYEYLWEAYEDGLLRFQWLGNAVEEILVDDSATRGVAVSGPGTAEVLSWPIIMRPGYPAPIPKGLDVDTAVTSSDRKPSFGWEFPVKWSAMRIWSTMWAAAWRRKAAKWVTCTFTPLVDSAGKKWEYVPTVSTVAGEGFRPTPGTNLLDFLDECTGQDYGKYFAARAEWYMHPGFKLDVRQTRHELSNPRGGIGTNKEKKVIFYEAQVQFKQRVRSRENIANHVVVIDANGTESVAADAASVAKWNRRELLQNRAANLTDPARRARVSKLYLAQSRDEEAQWVIQVPHNLPGRRPFYDYNVGDWIGVNTFQGAAASRTDAYRVLAIVVKVTDEETTVELTLQSKMEFRQKQLEERITNIINKPNIINNIINNPPRRGTDGTDGVDGKPGAVPIVRYPDGTTGYGDPIEPGAKVWIQATDPGSKAKFGDFWVDTDYVEPPPPFVPQEQPSAVIIDDTDGSEWSFGPDEPPLMSPEAVEWYDIWSAPNPMVPARNLGEAWRRDGGGRF